MPWEDHEQRHFERHLLERLSSIARSFDTIAHGVTRIAKAIEVKPPTARVLASFKLRVSPPTPEK